MYKVYLAGPMTGMSYNEANTWRVQAAEQLRRWGFESVSPLRDKPELELEDCIGQNYNTLHESDRAIITRDRYDVMSSHIILANFRGAQLISGGTFAEYAWADIQRIPVVTVMEKEGNPNDHMFIRELSGYRVETLEEGLQVVKSIFNR